LAETLNVASSIELKRLNHARDSKASRNAWRPPSLEIRDPATSMKILATRRYPGDSFEELDDVEVSPLAALTRPRADVEALVVANEPVPLDLLPNLRLVANFGVGYDRVDVEACAERGVVVTNTPDVLSDATADLAFALILATRRQVVEGDRLVRSNGWAGSWSEGGLAEEVTGSTLGIVGLGRIGSAVARRARGFELRVVYTQRRPVDTDLAEFRDLDALFAEADIVTIHAPLTPETAGLVDARRLSLLRDGACLVNTARGEIVDEEALVAELVSGRIRAGLDVFAHEPEVPSELLGLSNVVLTPHIGSATWQTRAKMTRVMVDNLLALERGEPAITPVRT
jgi:glyoxylate reductase